MSFFDYESMDMMHLHLFTSSFIQKKKRCIYLDHENRKKECHLISVGVISFVWPIHLIHFENSTKAGVQIIMPVPSFFMQTLIL